MNRLITLSALTLAGSGVVALAKPEQTAKTFGFSIDNAEHRHDVRAIHGAATLAMAGLLLVRPSSAGTVGIVLAATAGGRAASVAMEGEEPSQATKTAIGVETGLAAALLLGRTGIAAGNAASAIAEGASSAASAISDTATSAASSVGDVVGR